MAAAMQSMHELWLILLASCRHEIFALNKAACFLSHPLLH